MAKNVNLGIFAISTVGLFALLYLTTGSFIPNSGPAMIWFHSGLLALIVARFVIEYRFTKPNDVFLNCLAVFVSVSTLDQPPMAQWWEILRWGAFAIGVLALGLSWDQRIHPEDRPSMIRRIAYIAATSLGRSTVIFSTVFVLGLLSYFDQEDHQAIVLTVAWGVILIVANLNLERLGKAVRRKSSRTVLGHVDSFLAPRTIFFERADGVRLQNHQIVVVSHRGKSNDGAAAMIIGERRSPYKIQYVANLIDTTLQESEIDSRSSIYHIDEEETNNLLGLEGPSLIVDAARSVGIVAPGTSVSTLKFEVFGTPKLATGSLMEASHVSGKVYYQVFDGLLIEESTLDHNERAYVSGHAEQVGQWDPERNGFKTFGWLTDENAPVQLVDEEAEMEEINLAENEIAIGKVPKSSFPAVISIDDLALFHSAILGVTGSGKSFLTFEIIENCARRGIKVVCVDPTGDYQRYLSNAVIIKSQNRLKSFLDSPDHTIGIFETALNKTNPILQNHNAAEICLEWCKENREEEQIIRPEPKVLFVMEEAHLLVPEWNFNPVKGLQDKVNLSSQIVLQARKYGLGFLVVAQRTANVLKSVLNQCNTIIALQQFDQTGFDFLANYMGKHHVTSLPNLPERHGIIVGKASKSQRPIMVRFNDQDRSINENPTPDFVPPKKEGTDDVTPGPKIVPASDLGFG